MSAELTEEIIVIDSTDTTKPKERVDSWIHPLDRPEMREYLSQTLPPEISDRLIQATRPATSQNTTVNELQESERIQAKRKPMPYEPTSGWAARVLYEESFATYDEPGQQLLFVIGGILTHFDITQEQREYLQPLLNSPTLIQTPAQELPGRLRDTLEANKQLQSNADINGFLRLNETIGYVGLGRSPLHKKAFTLPPVHMIMRNLNSIATAPLTARTYEAGWQRVQAAAIYEDQLQKPVIDTVLMEEFNIPEGTDTNGALLKAFDYLRKPGNGIITENGSYESENNPRFAEGIRKLAVLRGSPDFQFLYQHYSFKGDLNAVKPNE